jgi:hypothetical protein
MLGVGIKHTDEQHRKTSWTMTWDMFLIREIMLLLKLSTLNKRVFLYSGCVLIIEVVRLNSP